MAVVIASSIAISKSLKKLNRKKHMIFSRTSPHRLHHVVVSEEQARETMQCMGMVVVQQNTDDENYLEMASDFDGNVVLQAADELVFSVINQSNGCTVPVVHARRKAVRAHAEG